MQSWLRRLCCQPFWGSTRSNLSSPDKSWLLYQTQYLCPRLGSNWDWRQDGRTLSRPNTSSSAWAFSSFIIRITLLYIVYFKLRLEDEPDNFCCYNLNLNHYYNPSWGYRKDSCIISLQSNRIHSWDTTTTHNKVKK